MDVLSAGRFPQAYRAASSFVRIPFAELPLQPPSPGKRFIDKRTTTAELFFKKGLTFSFFVGIISDVGIATRRYSSVGRAADS